MAALMSAVLTAAAPASLHTVVPTECTPYFTWQSVGMYFSHRRSGQHGAFTRILCCTTEQFTELSKEERTLVPTHVAPSYTHHPRIDDTYNAYNKPVAVIDWLATTDVHEDYILVIDADMIMRQPFLVEVSTPRTDGRGCSFKPPIINARIAHLQEIGARRGQPVAAYYDYMAGVANALAEKHVPEVLPRNDTLAGEHISVSCNVFTTRLRPRHSCTC
jgi:peptidyl serine alpha-galactosyltransferase